MKYRIRILQMINLYMHQEQTEYMVYIPYDEDEHSHKNFHICIPFVNNIYK